MCISAHPRAVGDKGLCTFESRIEHHLGWCDNLFGPRAMARKKQRAFDAKAFLETAGLGKRLGTYRRGDIVFSQGDLADTVLYVRDGEVQLSVLSHTGKEAIVATLRSGDFLGEGALAGQPIRLV